jgi:hypothetical protein
LRVRPETETKASAESPVIQAQIARENPLIALATQFGDASGLRGALRSALGTRPNSNDINIKTEPHDRGSILVAAMFDAYFTIYTCRTTDLFHIYRAGGATLGQPDLPITTVRIRPSIGPSTSTIHDS